MKARLLRKTGATTKAAPLGASRWREVLDEADALLAAAADSLEDEAVCDLWLEEPMSFMAGWEQPEHQAQSPMIRRVKVGGARRSNDLVRQAAWDQDFKDAQEHARRLLGGLG